MLLLYHSFHIINHIFLHSCLNTFSADNLITSFILSSSSVINGIIGVNNVPTNNPASDSFFITSNLLEDTHTLGSIIFDNSSFAVVIVNFNTTQKYYISISNKRKKLAVEKENAV